MEVRPTAEVTQRRSFNPKLSVVLENTSQHEETFLLEQEAWRENAALASDVIATPGFRSYFASEALAPGQNLSIKKLFFLFTDLKNSVRIYELYGDAPAYGACRGHFAAMRTIIESHGGSVVKTVGDSVMAVFVEPVPALLVAQEILNQESVFRPLPLREDLEIKLGLHGGPCIATNANGTLDFFGRTVNMAARFQDLSRGGDLVVSSELAKLPEVVGVLDELSLESTEDSAVLKGMTEATSFLRVHLR
jgi:class 3 adenylate cyclase